MRKSFSTQQSFPLVQAFARISDVILGQFIFTAVEANHRLS